MKLIIFIILLFPLLSDAQIHSEVIEVPGKSADQMYKAAKEWFALTFKSANDVIQLDDPTERKIIGKGVKQVQALVGGVPSYLNIHFNLLVQFRDGRYKYNIESTELKSASGHSYTYEELKATATEEGLNAYYNKLNINPRMLGSRVFEDNLKSNQKLVTDAEIQLKGIIIDMDRSLRKVDDDEDW